MIKSKADYKSYIDADNEAFFNGKKSLFCYFNLAYRFYHALRRCEYFSNCKNDPLSKLFRLVYLVQYRRIGRKLGWDIPLNTLGKGTRIMHPGTVVINGNAVVGDYCKIHVCVNIGASNGSKVASRIGNSVYIGPGAKIFGDIEIADNIAIGANAVVNHSFLESGITIAGVPAKMVSNKGYYQAVED